MAAKGESSSVGLEKGGHITKRPHLLSPKTDSNDEDNSHALGPLTINTQSLENFGLGPNYTELQPIGFGVHGLVVSALDRNKKQRVAVKKIKVESQLSCKYALREVRIMCQMRHDNIVRVLDVLLQDGSQHTPTRRTRRQIQDDHGPSQMLQMYIITELLDTNLHVLINQKLVESEHIALITYQLLRGLHYLRSANVIHRDLKPSNIFLNCDTLLLKIGDFGLARIVDPQYSHAGHLTADLGTYWYRAPELMLTPQSYTSSVDMWSAGCIIAEMLLGKPLFTGATDVDQLRHVIDTVELTKQDWSTLLHVLPNRVLHHHPLKPQRPLSHRLNDVEPAVVDLLENILTFDPHNRMLPIEALSHQYLAMYAKPKQEPVVTNAFKIEAEVDDLSAEKLKRMIYEEKHKKWGQCGICIPLPSPVERPKVSSAILSLRTGLADGSKQVPTSPTHDAILQEQRRNRRNKMSASVDLSFINLPESSKPQAAQSTMQDAEKAVNSTRDSAPPCPWKWPDIKLGEEDKKVDSEPLGANSLGSPETRSQDKGVIFKHIPTINTGSTSASSSLNSTVSRAAKSALPTELELRTRRAKPKKRGFVDVGGFDDEDFIHLGLPESEIRRHSADPLSLGKIETYEEKDQSRIDRELNRKNRTASMDLSYVHTPRASFNQPARSKMMTTNNRLSLGNMEQQSIMSSENRSPISEAIIRPELPAVVTMTSALMGNNGRNKRHSDVGIKVIKSPNPHRKTLATPSSESTSSSLALNEHLRSSVTSSSDSSSSRSISERKISVASIDSPQVSSSRPTSRQDSTRSTNTSFINITPAQPMSGGMTPHRPSSVISSGLLDTGMNKSNLIAAHMNPDKTNLIAAHMTTNQSEAAQPQNSLQSQSKVTYRNNRYQSSESTEGEPTRASSSADGNIPERPPSVVSTLTIPTLSPVQDSTMYTPTRKISYSTVFLESTSASKETTAATGKDMAPSGIITDRCTSAEPPRCSSRLSIDLSSVNKEQQKRQEEEKDKVEVSPRKLQEDWEIESQSSSSQKSEWTLSEILGMPEEEVSRNPPSSTRNRRLSSDQDNQGAASLYTSASTDVDTPAEPVRQRKICRSKIDLIPYSVVSPESAQKPITFTAARQYESQHVPNPDGNSAATTKLEDLTAERDKMKYTTECFIGNSNNTPSTRRLSTDKVSRNKDFGVTFKDATKEHLHLDFKHPHAPTKAYHQARTESPSAASALAKFSHYKSEEDLASPRSHSPRDVIGARAAITRDMPDLSEFKQNVKENLSSLSVSIPKDFPEKRRLIKAHSTESVCSEGESSSQKCQETDRSTEDLIQFSPVTASTKPDSQHWSQAFSAENKGESQQPQASSHTSQSGCNHCVYKTDQSCQQHSDIREQPFANSATTSHKNAMEMSKNVEHQADGGSSHHPPTSDTLLCEEPEYWGNGVRRRRFGSRSSLDQICLSKDVYNERQKLMGAMHGERDEQYQSESTERQVRRVRPRSAKK